MKRIIISTVLLLSILLVILAFFCWRNPAVVKYCIGEGRILRKVPSVVKVDGKKIRNAYCFLQETYFDGKPADILVLWLPDKSAYYGRDVIMIDRKNLDVGTPSSSNIGYGLLLGRFLLQSQSRDRYVSFKSLKWGKKDPKLEIKNDLITFVYSNYSPETQEEKQEQIEIMINKQD